MKKLLTPNKLTRREFATRAASAVGVIATTTAAASVQGANRTVEQSDPAAPFNVPQGTQQFNYHNVMYDVSAYGTGLVLV